jgi:DNA topoisomerase-1
LSNRSLSQAKILATIVRLLDSTSMRIGNEEYSKHNHTFGLTTLRERHVEVRGETLNFFFRGKSGIRHRISLEDRVLAEIVRRLRDLPGYELFQYVDDESKPHTVNSMDVNMYIRETSGEEFTAKDFRTWNGTVLAAAALGELDIGEPQRSRAKNIVRAVESVAGHLGNSTAICRKCYIHPAVLDAYLAESLARGLAGAPRVSGLSHDESAVLHFLRSIERVRSRHRHGAAPKP